MRVMVAMLVALMWSGVALCQEAVQASGGTKWYEPILAAVGVAIATVLVRLINNWAAKEAEEVNIAKQDGKKILKERIEASFARIVANIANKELIELKNAAADGKIDKADLKKLEIVAKDELRDEFSREGVDVMKEVGDKYLGSALRNNVDKFNSSR